jgi:hypothetical protein
MNTDTHSLLAQHVIHGSPIMPAAGYLEMGCTCTVCPLLSYTYLIMQALEFGASRVWDITFHSIFTLSNPEPMSISITLNENEWKVVSHVKVGLICQDDSAHANRNSQAGEKLHADGCLSLDPPTMEHNVDLDIVAMKQRLDEQPESELNSSLAQKFLN